MDVPAFKIANQVYHPSYLSLDWALGYYGMIPEHVPNLTSVTTNRNLNFRFKNRFSLDWLKELRLQNYLLFLMQKTGMSSRVFFLGGTALRFLYRIRRFSEDLDFSAGVKWSSTDLNQYIKKFKRELLKMTCPQCLQEKSMQF